MKREKKLLHWLLAILACSMMVTEGMLMYEGRWREAVPLHLCSLSAIASGWLACAPTQVILNFLWYLGMPGAALALLFPAPASSVCPLLLNASYFATHALILMIPIVRMIFGMRPERRKKGQAMLVLLMIACLAAAGNRILGTNFLFLALPPAGTPLEAVFSLGYPAYWCAMFLLMLICCMAMDWTAGRIFSRTTE